MGVTAPSLVFVGAATAGQGSSDLRSLAGGRGLAIVHPTNESASPQEGSTRCPRERDLNAPILSAADFRRV